MKLNEELLIKWFKDILAKRRNNELSSDKLEKEIRDILDKYNIKC